MKNGTVTYTPVAFLRKGSSKADAIAIANRKTLKRHHSVKGGDAFESYTCEEQALAHLIGEFGSIFWMGFKDTRNVQAWMIKEEDGVRTAELICEHEQNEWICSTGLFPLEVLHKAEAWEAFPHDPRMMYRYLEFLEKRHQPRKEQQSEELPIAA